MKKRQKLLPESINPEENGRVKTSMTNNLGLAHLESLRHPVQEGEISPEIEVDEFGHHEIGRPSGTPSPSTDVPFGEVDSVVDGLDSEHRESQQEGECRENVDQSRDPDIT